MIVLGRDTVTGASIEIPITDGKVDVNATVAPAEGGATSAKQDSAITLLAGGLPVALAGGGGLKVELNAALPAGTAVVGSVVPTNAAGVALLPTAAAASNSSAANPTTTFVKAVVMAREENSDTLRRVTCNSTNKLQVTPDAVSMTTTSRTSGSSYEAQRGIDFGCAPGFIRVYSRLAGYILLINKGSDAVDGDAPYGADVFKIAADSTIQIDMSTVGESFTSGCQVVLSTTPEQVTLPGTSDIRVTIQGT